jgi:hypothetical protein
MRARRWPFLLAVTCLLAGGLAGCTDAITVWPIAQGVPLDGVEVPPLAGHWRVAGGGEEAPTLEVGHVPGERGQCRGGRVTYTENGNVSEIGDQTCFINLGGNLVAELRSVAPMAGFYRQYLVRVDTDRVEVCVGLPVWVILAELQKGGLVGFSLDTLQYTVRDQETGDLMVFISRPEPLREFLDIALPEAVARCDRADDDFEWIAFERYEPEEPAAAPD